MFNHRLIKKIITIFISTFMFANVSYAGCDASCATSVASGISVLATASVVAGSLQALENSGQIVVDSIEAVGSGFVIVVKSVSTGIKSSIKVSSEVLQNASLVAGTSVTLVASAAGHMLILAGKAIAFIPNTVGTALLHQSKVQ